MQQVLAVSMDRVEQEVTTIFLALDFMSGVGDQRYALAASDQALSAIACARSRKIPVIFTKVGFRSGHPEVSVRNKTFGVLVGTDRLVGDASRLLDAFAPQAEEPVLDKKRFSAFSGSGLWTIIRASGASSIVMCGLSTSGVVLSTALQLVDDDFEVILLADACADPDIAVHDTIVEKILASRLTIMSVAAWTASSRQPEREA